MQGVLKVRHLRLATHKWAVACALLLGSTQGAWADFLSSTLYYTTYNGGQNVNKVAYTYDTVTHVFTQGSGVNVASTPGADGIIFDSTGNLLVGGQGSNGSALVHRVNPVSGAFTSVTANAANGAYHMTLDPSGNVAYATGIPGGLASIPLTPFGNGTAHTLLGSNSAITSMAFNGAGTGVYTTAGPGSSGDVGFINLATYTTTRIHTNVAGAHGLTFDPFTNTFIMFSGSTMVQFANDATLTILATRTFNGENFDQGTVDGMGHVFVASNTGDLVFMDYSAAAGGLISDAGNTVHTQFLAFFLDDVAPLVGAGSNPLPAPAGMSLAFIGVAGLAGYSWLKRKKTQPVAC